VIICLQAGASINKQQLYNAVFNNWHGYGLVLRDQNNRLQILKGFDELGTNPEVVWKLLEDNKDIERYLHVRHSTKGAADETNVQPFEVYNSNERQVFFMHNGTLSTFGGAWNNDQGKSDTLDFCDKILSPALLRWNGPQGKADYTDEDFYRLVVEKQWTSNSTGLFVSNDLPMLRIGSGWSVYKHPDDSSSGEVHVSNTSYFDRIQRGPEFQRLENLKKAEEEKKKKEEMNSSVPFDPTNPNARTRSSIMQEWDGDQNGRSINTEVLKFNNSNLAKSPKVLKALGDIVNTWDFEDPADIQKLTFVAYDEWISFIDNEGEWAVAALIEHLTQHYHKVFTQNILLQHEIEKLQNKQKKAEEKIRSLKEITLEKKEYKSSEAA
jgi:mRNA-degrading endonuclease HigB of HigAB toxin-antitoxin module